MNLPTTGRKDVSFAKHDFCVGWLWALRSPGDLGAEILGSVRILPTCLYDDVSAEFYAYDAGT